MKTTVGVDSKYLELDQLQELNNRFQKFTHCYSSPDTETTLITKLWTYTVKAKKLGEFILAVVAKQAEYNKRNVRLGWTHDSVCKLLPPNCMIPYYCSIVKDSTTYAAYLIPCETLC